jgi:hypothetical protein
VLLRLWRSFRLFFLILVFLALALFLAVTTPWQRWFGTRPNYAALIAQGQPLVAAINRFHQDCDLWPEYLDDLFPRYLIARPSAAWYYTVTPEGPALSTSTHERRTHVGYDFDPLHPQWRVFGEVDNRPLSSTPPPATTSAPTPDTILANELAELDRRIAREPSLLDHRRGKASLLRSLGRLDDARTTITQAAADLPQAAWPPLALAALDLTLQSADTFVQWVAAYPSFTHTYDLSLLHRQLHDDPSALADLHAALHYPLRIADDDPQTLAFYLWDMARYALHQNDPALALQLTDAWDRALAAHQLPESSIAPLRAAAQFAQHDDPTALATMQSFDARPLPTWAAHLNELRTALTTHNHAFTYDPGPVPPAYDIFQLPQ